MSDMPRRKHVTAACGACRRRKSKCSGSQPCDRCEQAKTACSYDQQIDGRRAESLKRKIDEYERDRIILDLLLEAIKTSTKEDTQQILAVIRNRASIDQIKTDLKRMFENQQSDMDVDGSSSTTESQKQMPRLTKVSTKVSTSTNSGADSIEPDNTTRRAMRIESLIDRNS